MFYHKVYMNQIHSSSLLCQLAAMWKSQVLCDAVIKTGNVSTKAHRVVLVAACPMLHSMKNASTGSNLEVRLASDISQEAVNTFLQYLYEGFMMLTEANCKDVEKIARVLQVDNVLKCCSDFYKCLHAGNGYEYNFHDNVEFRHVRASDLLKVHERSKRAGETMRADSPGTKRMRSFRTGSADQSWQTDHGAGMSSADPWDRVPREGLMSSRGSQPGIIDMVEDSVEIVHTEPLSDSGGKSNSNRSVTLPQDRVALSVASQMNASSDVQIIDTSYANSGQSGNTQQDSISVIGSYSSPQYQHTASSHSTPHTTRQSRADAAPRFQTPPTSHKSHIPSQSPPRIRGSSSQPKPFAVGSASQSMGAVSPSVSSPARESPVVPSPVSLWRSQSAEMINVPPDKSPSSMR
ncbi:hypothetical protein FSP39_003274 [Pinctada imbricata]|uniref:BTB domain-containing protein n=1 Tax=Pinctada imbricata TaxID=66713 RepID=A0AA89BYI8_PINIB|nr:hypothetical protein FSP39_003274 [Pinctada imbricata]